jgi:hypothetical protein
MSDDGAMGVVTSLEASFLGTYLSLRHFRWSVVM